MLGSGGCGRRTLQVTITFEREEKSMVPCECTATINRRVFPTFYEPVVGNRRFLPFAQRWKW